MACKHTNAITIGHQWVGAFRVEYAVLWCRCCGAVNARWPRKRDPQRVTKATWRNARHPQLDASQPIKQVP